MTDSPPKVIANSQPAANGLATLQASYRAGRHAEAIATVERSRGPGMSLPAATQSSLERHFGHNLSGVRIHTDDWAVEAASRLEANAFTVGRDIFFGAGQFAPNHGDGRLRLAHEVAHTLQQRNGGTAGTWQVPMLEQQADRAAVFGRWAGPLTNTGQMLLCEPTYPRRATGNRILAEAERIITTTRDTGSSDEVTKLWSQVGTNFPGVDTVGSLARRVWTNLFLRHFVEPESQPGVESTHPRYMYSRQYGWIDGQHFFGFIDFAEQQHQENGGDRAKTLTKATQEGIDIEKNQQSVRDLLVFGASQPTGGNPVDNTTRLLQIQTPNTPAFRAPPAVAGAMATMAASIYLSTLGLSGTRKELFNLLNDEQQARFYTDNAKSAFSYEDIVSNQLGTQFFLSQGKGINSKSPAARAPEFLSALASFFDGIQIENDPAKLEALAKTLPFKERFTAPKTTEQAERQKHPELFTLPP